MQITLLSAMAQPRKQLQPGFGISAKTLPHVSAVETQHYILIMSPKEWEKLRPRLLKELDSAEAKFGKANIPVTRRFVLENNSIELYHPDLKISLVKLQVGQFKSDARGAKIAVTFVTNSLPKEDVDKLFPSLIESELPTSPLPLKRLPGTRKQPAKKPKRHSFFHRNRLPRS